MSVRFLLYFNALLLALLAGYLAYRVLSPRRAVDRTAPNQERFLGDDDLEGRRLERVLGWGLLFAAVVAVTLPLYWLREPVRQDQSSTYFEDGALERGAMLFASAGDEAFDSVLSLQCANCHGADGSGGSANQVIDLDGDGPRPPQRFVWRAPALNTVLLRFQEDPECADDRRAATHVCEVSEIITHGRPGTPMQAFGVAGGGAENTQTIHDLIAFLRSIQLSPAAAQAQATAALTAEQAAPAEQVTAAETALADARTAAEEDLAAMREVVGSPDASEESLLARCEEVEAALDADDTADVTADVRDACRKFVDAIDARDAAEANLEWAQEWAASRTDVTDGQILFELYCARCHTEGWSVFNPADATTAAALGVPGGGGGSGGGIGFNLRDGATIRRFGPGDQGVASQHAFVADGSTRNVEYGIGGIGSGRMPGFGDMLTQEQVAAIVEYERSGLDTTTYPGPRAAGTASADTTTTTTTTTEG